jgi:hypothetical protein
VYWPQTVRIAEGKILMSGRERSHLGALFNVRLCERFYLAIRVLNCRLVSALLVVLAFVTPGLAQDTLDESIAHELASDAFQCSDAALKLYALADSETTEIVADAAFEKCSDKWTKYAEFGGEMLDSSGLLKEAQSTCEKARGLNCPAHPSGSYYALQAARRTFLAKAEKLVLEIRADAKKN